VIICSASGFTAFENDPHKWCDWIADVERPAAQYRGRYQLKLDQARLLARHAARLADAGKPFSTEAAMAKLAASEAAVFATWAAVQTLAGAGYIRDSLVQKWYRDAKLYTIFEGTSEIHRLVIGRALRAQASTYPLDQSMNHPR